MKLEFGQKLFAFIMLTMVFSVLPRLMDAQPSLDAQFSMAPPDPCKHVHCPRGYTCILGVCVCTSCGGWSVDPNQVSDLISVSGNRDLDINFALAEAKEVVFTVYDLDGQLIKTLDQSWSSPDGHQFEWDQTDTAGNLVSPGLYIIQLEAGPGYAGAQKRIVIN